ncbi:MAG: YkgJ family cysteine cluster protein [Planctomycetaceae bacterium]|nr:YkgJ family cysteine cluster protein [Planctomycetaceae bacterium]
MPRPWYRDGLRFSCTGCGDCCSGEPGYVWVNRAEIKALATAMGLDAAEFERRCVRTVGTHKSLIERPGGDCVLLDAKSRRCQVYDARPRQCRTWPFWPSNLVSRAAWLETCDRCRGCNHGSLVPLETIADQMKQTEE